MKLDALRPRLGRTVVGVALLAAVLVPLVSSSSGAAPVCNNTPITFTPPSEPTPAVLPYAPYPSTIVLTGLTGTITDVNVTLNGFTYVRPEDVDVLLVAPDGTTNVVVMSDIGGDNAFPGEAVSGVNLTFDDEAASAAPTDSQLSSGSFQPTDDDNDTGDGEFVPNHADTFVAPAPAPSNATTLSTFDGLAPNGTWSLYIVDDQPGPPVSASFSGWCIDVSTSATTTVAPTTSSSTSMSSTSTTSTVPPSTTTSTTTQTGATCAGLTATIVGTGGNDTIVGTSGPDVIAAGGGDDTVNGFGGNDTICGGDGNDNLSGDSGNDTVRGDAGNDTINGGGGDDDIAGGAGDDSINANDGTDHAVGDAGNDEISGGGGDDFVAGGIGNDRLNGGAGNDVVQGDEGTDRVVGGPGNDQLAGNTGVDRLEAVDSPTGADTLTGGAEADVCFSDAADVPPSLVGADC